MSKKKRVQLSGWDAEDELEEIGKVWTYKETETEHRQLVPECDIRWVEKGEKWHNLISLLWWPDMQRHFIFSRDSFCLHYLVFVNKGHLTVTNIHPPSHPHVLLTCSCSFKEATSFLYFSWKVFFSLSNCSCRFFTRSLWTIRNH